jgi:isocitrate/isopropylmalate dehydrogenase
MAWLPGDSVGIEVLEAAKIVLDKIQLDAECIHGDIGWKTLNQNLKRKKP